MDQVLALRTFTRIIETGSLAKAAGSLDLPRSTVSKLLQDLESHVGARLIARSTRATSPTAEGQGDRVLLQQAIVNLARNALEAMSANGRTRRLLITSRSVGERAEIAVTDTGTGFSPENVQRAFDAFFSTRESGLGLGLAICRSTIEAHGGKIRILSTDDHGATLVACLPLSR